MVCARTRVETCRVIIFDLQNRFYYLIFTPPCPLPCPYPCARKPIAGRGRKGVNATRHAALPQLPSFYQSPLDNYKFIRTIGTGSSAIVKLATRLSDGEVVAIKVSVARGDAISLPASSGTSIQPCTGVLHMRQSRRLLCLNSDIPQNSQRKSFLITFFNLFFFSIFFSSFLSLCLAFLSDN